MAHLSGLIEPKFLERIGIRINFGVVRRVDFGRWIAVRSEIGFGILGFCHGIFADSYFGFLLNSHGFRLVCILGKLYIGMGLEMKMVTGAFEEFCALYRLRSQASPSQPRIHPEFADFLFRLIFRCCSLIPYPLH